MLRTLSERSELSESVCTAARSAEQALTSLLTLTSYNELPDKWGLLYVENLIHFLSFKL